ncbi:MAG TPA: hypothetical protein VGJ51_12895 [Candidatus Angelobacter sp.]
MKALNAALKSRSSTGSSYSNTKTAVGRDGQMEGLGQAGQTVPQDRRPAG